MTTIEIKHRDTGSVLYSGEHESLREAMEAAVLAGAYLDRANLAGANLDRAYLAGAYLDRASLAGAYLDRAYLDRAYLAGANLAGARLAGARLAGATLSWSSHALLSEILWCAADTEPRQMLAAYVGRRTDWCWDDWRTWDHPERDWAIGVLREWVRDGDDAPGWLRGEEDEG